VAERASELTKRLVALLATHSLRRGSFVLASGGKSSYYIDARLTTMRPDGLTCIGQLALLEFADLAWRPDAVGGMTMGADPIAYSIAYASAASPNAIRAFTVRKEPKAHGMQQLVEGPVTPADTVVIVEDVLTTGGSALRATRAVQALGARIVGVLAVVDREEGGSAALAQAGLQVRSLTKVSDILSHSG